MVSHSIAVPRKSGRVSAKGDLKLENHETDDVEQSVYVPALPHIQVSETGDHALLGARCSTCDAVVEGERLACPACGARDTLRPTLLAHAGRIAAHTIVHRSFPGVQVPFVFVVVDLEGGGSVRGTLVDFDPMAELPAEQPVQMIFRDTGQRDRDGKPFLSYYFAPHGSAAA